MTLSTASISFPKLRYHDNLSTLLDTLNASLSLGQNSVIVCLRHTHKLKSQKQLHIFQFYVIGKEASNLSFLSKKSALKGILRYYTKFSWQRFLQTPNLTTPNFRDIGELFKNKPFSFFQYFLSFLSTSSFCLKKSKKKKKRENLMSRNFVS